MTQAAGLHTEGREWAEWPVVQWRSGHSEPINLVVWEMVQPTELMASLGLKHPVKGIIRPFLQIGNKKNSLALGCTRSLRWRHELNSGPLSPHLPSQSQVQSFPFYLCANLKLKTTFLGGMDESGAMGTARKKFRWQLKQGKRRSGEKSDLCLLC